MDTVSLAARPRRTLALRRRHAGSIVNDVHSQLNATNVPAILRPTTVGELQSIVRHAVETGSHISVCGGRHAMGGQQFAAGTALVDTTGLSRVVDVDSDRGLVTVEAGVDWVQLINHLLWTFPCQQDAWGIVQKQTGADHLTLGGALASNIHGRGLRLRPIVGDVESFEIIDASGALVFCSRITNPRLFSLAIGGYGMFGPIARVTLRLARRRKVERRVTIACIDDLPRLFDQRIREGYEYGDCQFATDPASREFLHAGVFSCYRPVAADIPIPDDQRALSIHEWRRLLRLAHTAKSRAFAEYARYYMATDGQLYWSDTHQLSAYPESYHADLDRDLGATVNGSEMISELYVPRTAVPDFMRAVRADARQHGVNIIYGTIRLIEQDDETVLAWARERWACVVFNLHVDHTAEGIAKAASDFRRLIDRAIELGGSYYLTYHRWATAEQILKCHPRIVEFLREKRHHDPEGVFRSDWYTHHVRLLEGRRESADLHRRGSAESRIHGGES
jgi:FAD/FMN-containing dehydrogenase